MSPAAGCDFCGVDGVDHDDVQRILANSATLFFFDRIRKQQTTDLQNHPLEPRFWDKMHPKPWTEVHIVAPRCARYGLLNIRTDNGITPHKLMTSPECTNMSHTYILIYIDIYIYI